MCLRTVASFGIIKEFAPHVWSYINIIEQKLYDCGHAINR